MTLKMATHSLEHGTKFPYDATDAWWEGDAENPPPAKDWAHVAARGVMADLKDRCGIRQALEELDEEVRIELVESLSEIIRAAASMKN